MKLNGSEHTTIVTGIGWPHGVAIDYKENRVCWSVAMLGRYALEPPVKKEVSVLLNDADNGTCLALAETPHYKFDASDSHWLPHPRQDCWMSGLVIQRCVPDRMKTSFTLTITGHHLSCSTSHFKVGVRKTKWSGCALAGKFIMCKWGEAVMSGGLTTCKAACRCDGDDCKHVIVHFPQLYEEWRICEINME
ncbi:hypothetical protein NP493_1913g00009 [Ridgeia piscesae]|uniref:Uncharacterized protein n=1 Tax=Ridgeia piscesae TaxID=27915 RepID=A0AAD9JQA5_RIDPI|nr:hypothetical protein NP493_1913g00009 [Ridgeia piscesae]